MDVVKYQKKPREISAVRPWLTAVLLLMCLWGFAQVAANGLLHAKDNAFCPGKFLYLYQSGNFIEILRNMLLATFYQLNIWQFLPGVYFLWVFGSTVETRLGTGRLFIVVLSCLVGGWMILGFSLESEPESFFIGPGLLTAGLIGAYLNFFPERRINPAGAFLDSRYKIFKNEPPLDLTEGFGIPPWVLIAAFIAFQVIAHFLMGRMSTEFDTARVMPALITALVGLAVTAGLIFLATAGGSGNPLERLARQKYKELRKLDLTHEQAVVGAARLVSVPPEKVRFWVAKGQQQLPEA